MICTANSWLGLAPKGAQQGDLIYILYGCSVPVVLRKVEKSRADLKKELEDEEIRKANVVMYIRKNLAARARCKRLDQAKETDKTLSSKDMEKSGKRVASSDPEAALRIAIKKAHVESAPINSVYQPADIKGGQAPGYYY
ncbi:hypothetical protein B0J13DRAFT_530416 [Dactylonectria estremocensis]|uniref:Uncharacterized protein n=1 Tax=Dactylonectria estremocensis TaxID=1079267 RepID=A0A9P9ISL1_9HYPO|nr:hypothetical protein B0J13DRAFT_530416 [Dactylonectria estremocensis]